MTWSKVSTVKMAERAAMKEAADTIGVIAPIRTVEVQRDKLTVVIELSPGRIGPGLSPAPGRPTIKAVGVGGVYIAPTAVYGREVFGFIVLRGPIHLLATNDSWGEDDPCLVALDVARPESLATGITTYGHPACSECNGRIDYKRIAVVPRTKMCTKCKNNKEIKENAPTIGNRRK